MKYVPFLLLTLGCADFATLASSRDALKVAINDARSRERCAPADLAMAEASLAFAEIELAEGNAQRALDHVNTGRTKVAVANTCASRMGSDIGAEVIPMPSTGGAPVIDATDEAPKATGTTAKVATPSATTTRTAPIGLSDRDGDGVSDDDDVCMNDPEDLDGFKDSDGCPELDNDGDSINDAADKCRDAAEDRDGFQDSDGCPETDNDADGVADAKDGCPNQAGLAATNGCPVVDGDSDGIPDEKDKCATVPENKNGFMDDDGCPDTAPNSSPATSASVTAKSSGSLATLTGTGITVTKPIEFVGTTSTLSSGSVLVLDAVAELLAANPNITIEIGGHTDNEGDDTANQTLSKDRADVCWEYLLSKGIEARRMRTVGYGETQPIDTNRTADGRARNRRIEFVLK